MKDIESFISSVFTWISKFFPSALIFVFIFLFFTYIRVDNSNFGYYVEIIKSLAWPLGVIVVTLVLNQPFTRLIDRINSIKGPGGTEIDAATQQKEKSLNTPSNDELNVLKEQINNLKDSYTANEKQKNIFWLGFQFEKIYRLIFGSQLKILQIAQENNNYISRGNALKIYSDTNWQSSNYNFDSYMNFLISSGLLKPQDELFNYSLEPFGKMFLEYLTSNGLSTKTKIPY